MFVYTKKIPAKAADAIDLVIEFATLGEYGLEYPEEPIGRNASASCTTRHPREKSLVESKGFARTRPAAINRPARLRRATCEHRATILPEALMPPRIEFDPNF